MLVSLVGKIKALFSGVLFSHKVKPHIFGVFFCEYKQIFSENQKKKNNAFLVYTKIKWGSYCLKYVFNIHSHFFSNFYIYTPQLHA